MYFKLVLERRQYLLGTYIGRKRKCTWNSIGKKAIYTWNFYWKENNMYLELVLGGNENVLGTLFGGK